MSNWELFKDGKRTGIIDPNKAEAEKFIDHMVKLRARCGEKAVRYTLKEVA